MFEVGPRFIQRQMIIHRFRGELSTFAPRPGDNIFGINKVIRKDLINYGNPLIKQEGRQPPGKG